MTKISEINYQGNLRVVSKHLQSGVELMTDAPTDNHGLGNSFSPTDLVSTALGNCMVTIMAITAANHSIPLGNIKADIYKIMEAQPRRIKEIVVELSIEDHSYDAKQKQLLEYAALNCPVAKSLSSELIQTVRFNYY